MFLGRRECVDWQQIGLRETEIYSCFSLFQEKRQIRTSGNVSRANEI